MEYGTVDLQAVASINCGNASRQISAEEYMIQNKLNNPSSFTLKIPYQATLVPSDKIAFQGEILVQRMDGMFAVDSRKPIVRSCLNGMPFHFVPDNTEAEDEINVLRVKIGKVFKQMEHKLRVVGLNKYTTKPDEDLVCVIAGLMTTKNNSLFPIERGDVIIAALPSVTRGKPQITNSNTSPHRRTMECRPLNENTLTDISYNDCEYLSEMTKTKEFQSVCQMMASYASSYVLRTVRFHYASDQIKDFVRENHAEGTPNFNNMYGGIFTKEICSTVNEVDEDMRQLMTEYLGDAIQKRISSKIDQGGGGVEAMVRDIFTPLRDIGYLLTSHVASRIIGVAQSDAACNKEFDIFIHPPQNLRRIPIPLLSPTPNKDDPNTYGRLYEYLPKRFNPKDIHDAYFEKGAKSDKYTYTGEFNLGYEENKKIRLTEEEEKDARKKRQHIEEEEEEKEDGFSMGGSYQDLDDEFEKRRKEIETQKKKDREAQEEKDREEEEKKNANRILFKKEEMIKAMTGGIKLLDQNVPRLVMSLIDLKYDEVVKQIYTRCISALIGITKIEAKNVENELPSGKPEVNDKVKEWDAFMTSLKIALLEYIKYLFALDEMNLDLNDKTKITEITKSIIEINKHPIDTVRELYHEMIKKYELKVDERVVIQMYTYHNVLKCLSEPIQTTENDYDYGPTIKSFCGEYTSYADIQDDNLDLRKTCWQSGSTVDIFVSDVNGDQSVENVNLDVFGFMKYLKFEHIPNNFKYDKLDIKELVVYKELNGATYTYNTTGEGISVLVTVQRIKDLFGFIQKYENKYASDMVKCILKFFVDDKFDIPQPGNIPPLAFVMTYVYAVSIFAILNPIKNNTSVKNSFPNLLKPKTIRYGGDIDNLMTTLYDIGLYKYDVEKDKTYILRVLNDPPLPNVGKDRQVYLNAERNALININKIAAMEKSLKHDYRADEANLKGRLFTSRNRIIDIDTQAMEMIRTHSSSDLSKALTHMYIFYKFIDKKNAFNFEVDGVIPPEVTVTFNQFYDEIPKMVHKIWDNCFNKTAVDYSILVQQLTTFKDAYDNQYDDEKLRDVKYNRLRSSVGELHSIYESLAVQNINYAYKKSTFLCFNFKFDSLKDTTPDAIETILNHDVTFHLLLPVFRLGRITQEIRQIIADYVMPSTFDEPLHMTFYMFSDEVSTVVMVKPTTAGNFYNNLRTKFVSYLRCYNFEERMQLYYMLSKRGIAEKSTIVSFDTMHVLQYALHASISMYLHNIAIKLLNDVANEEITEEFRTEFWDEVRKGCFSLIGCNNTADVIGRFKEATEVKKNKAEIQLILDEYKRETSTETAKIQKGCGMIDPITREGMVTKLLSDKATHLNYRTKMVEMYTKIHRKYFDKLTT